MNIFYFRKGKFFFGGTNVGSNDEIIAERTFILKSWSIRLFLGDTKDGRIKDRNTLG